MTQAGNETPGWALPDIDDRQPFGRKLGLIGFGIIAVFCGTFYFWASSAPIEGAVIAPGVVSVDTNVRTVQHLEGGIVDRILVREGDKVESGQVLITLQNTVSASSRNEIQAEYFETRATEARLAAEQSGLDEIEFPEELAQKVGDESARAAMNSQRKIFESRRALLVDRQTILARTKDGLASEITGLKGQVTSSEQRIEMTIDELADVENLYEKQLISKTRVLEVRREKAELEGEIARFQAAIGTAEQRIEEVELRLAELKSSMASEVAEQLRQTRARVYELGQRLTAAQDVIGRTEIRSPVAGVVTGLDVHTEGGVITAGQPLLDVVPVSDKLVVQATVDPLDIDQVAAGLPAQIWLSALNRRSQTPIDGTVTTVSADRMTDPNTGAAYYIARVELDRSAVEKGSVPLQPGMSADVMIRTGARTTWDYLSAPVSRFLSRGMREG